METDRIKDLDHQIDVQLQLIKLGIEEGQSDAFIMDRVKKIREFQAEIASIMAGERC